MDKIEWCMRKKHGIRLVEPNENLRLGYLKKAEDALDAVKTSRSSEWKIAAAYYAIYHSLYSCLMAVGVKSEIHSCTIELAKRFLSNILSRDDLKLLEDAFSARNDSQYYVDRTIPDTKVERVTKGAPGFFVRCKNAVLDEGCIKSIREHLS